MTRTKSNAGEDGFVLLVVLSAVLVLSALLFGFAQTTRTSLSKADSFYRTEQAWNGAWGGLQVALALVRDVDALAIDPPSAKLLTEESTFSVGDANCSVVIAEENGLLNVNCLQGADGQIDRPRIDQFLRLIDVLNHQQKDLPPIGYGIVPAIIDWIDSDDEVTCLPFVQHDKGSQTRAIALGVPILGAENDSYQTRTPPYSCANGPIGTLDELLWVKGMTPEAFGRLRPYLTCVGDGQIDLNAAPGLVIQSLAEQMDAATAEMIVRQRILKPFQSVAELHSVPGMTDNISHDLRSLITVHPTERFYRVTARGSIEGHHCTMEALLRRNTQAGTVDILQYREL